MLLSLLDVCFKLKYYAYASSINGYMEIFNDCIILHCSYIMFLFSDFVITQENKDFFGWFFNADVMLLLVSNLLTITFVVVK